MIEKSGVPKTILTLKFVFHKVDIVLWKLNNYKAFINRIDKNKHDFTNCTFYIDYDLLDVVLDVSKDLLSIYFVGVDKVPKSLLDLLLRCIQLTKPEDY